jgi:hypothetical protein
VGGAGLDDLARALARPMSRRRAVRYAAGALTATAFGGLFARPATASHCLYVTCQDLSNPNAHGCCEEGRTCCYNDAGTATDCCLPEEECRSGKCVDPCAGLTACTDECCQRNGQGQCCGALCCTPDQICDRSRNVCCPPDPDGSPCKVPEEACKKEKDEIVENLQSDCNSGGGDQFSNAASAMADDGIAMMSCSFTASTFERSRLYQDCPQRPSDALCDGGQCDAATLRCSQCIGARVSAKPAPLAEVERRRPARRGGGAVSPAELRRLVRGADRRFKRAAAAIFDALHDPVLAGLPLPALAAAIDGYRREIARLHRQLANGDGGRPQELALKALDEIAAMMGAYRAAALAETTAESQAAVARGEKRAKRARTASRRARRALGCGPERC